MLGVQAIINKQYIGADDMSTAIRFNNVNFFIDHTHILKDINGSIPIGKITTLVGPSGAGKTTLLKLCNGLISSTSGDIYIHNQAIHTYEPTALRRRVGIALQDAPMIKGTVYDNLALPLKLQGKNLSEADALHFLDDVGLEDEFLHHKTEDLSGGQRQKVSIARTLVNKTDILLLDEITSSLDQTSLHEIEALIVKINEKYNVTIIWITHNLEQAKSIGDCTWVMMDGRLMETGTSDLLNAPKDPHVKEFVTGAII